MLRTGMSSSSWRAANSVTASSAPSTSTVADARRTRSESVISVRSVGIRSFVPTADAPRSADRWAGPASALRVLRVAAEVDGDAGLVADRPGVVPRSDRRDVTGPDVGLGAVAHRDVHPAGDDVHQVRRLAAVGAGDRLDVVRPSPARLERAVEDRVAVDGDDGRLAVLGERPCLVRRLDALDLQRPHHRPPRRWSRTVTCRRSTSLLAKPFRFHGGSTGCTLPAASVAREQISCSPAGASHSYDQPRHARSPAWSPSVASSQLAPPSTLTSTRSTGAQPDHARPSSRHGPASRKRVRVIKSWIPGGTVSERGLIRVTGTPSSSSVS